MVGSEAGAVTHAIARAPKQRAIAATAVWTADAITVDATAPDGADVWVAVWEDAARTHVTRGENSGESLLGDRVVRRLERVAVAGHTGKVSVPLATTWRAGGAVAFAQRADQNIIGSRILPR